MQKFDKLIIASHNKGKLKEISALLEPFGVNVISALEYNLPEPEETETTFIGNALLKARAATAQTGLPALSDDSGLEVHALNGEPGIYSARWAIDPAAAHGERDFYYAMRLIESKLELAETNDYSARFICVLAIVWPNGEEMTFEGTIEGKLAFPPKGDKGFGYDPIFIANGESETFGEMDPEKKHAMSHRARAFEKLVERLFG